MANKKLRWVHKISLPDGTVTPGVWGKRFEKLGLFDVDFLNKRVLDIGCLDGQYTFFAEKADAKEVVSIDIIESIKNKNSYPQAAYTNAAYLTAHKAFKSKAKYVFPYSVYDIDSKDFGMFDVVLFLGVLYHLAHPLLALEKINKVMKKGGTLVLESEVSRTFTQFHNKNHLRHKLNQKSSSSLKTTAKAQVLNTIGRVFNDKKDVFNNDASVFWIPTTTVLERFLDLSGFKIIKKIDDGVSSRATYISTKTEEINPTYAAEGMYTNYKNRLSNLDFKK